MFDLLVRQARLADGRIMDIGIQGSQIAAVDAQLNADAARIIDAASQLTVPAFVNGQLHAGKSFWRRLLAEMPPEVQRLPRFEAARAIKKTYTPMDVYQRVDATMKLALKFGTGAIRLFGDVDAAARLTTIQGLLAIKEAYQPWMQVQVVAFPQDGVLGSETQSLMHEALKTGADLVGGIPWIEPNRRLQKKHIKMCFDLAQQYDRDLHFVCDDVLDPKLNTLEPIAEETQRRKWHSRVSATQCAALASYSDRQAARVIAKIRDAGLTVFSNSQVSLIATGGTQSQPMARGVTRIRELLDAGVRVACAQDDVDNWFYPFGRNDMLEVAQFAAHNAQFAWDGEVDRTLAMVTDTPAAAMGLPAYGLKVGDRADLVILGANSWHEAIQLQPRRRTVLLNGKLASVTRVETQTFT
jgi:cytosine deaminase